METAHCIFLKIPFQSNHHAEIARRVLQVDQELQPILVTRSLSTDGQSLVVAFSTQTVRLARLTLHSFLENLDLVCRTLAEFGDEAANANISTATS